MICYNAGVEHDFIAHTGFTYSAFNDLYRHFRPFFDKYTPYTGEDGRIRLVPQHENERKRGRPRKVNALICLGLILTWARTRGPLRQLQREFGMSYTTVSLYLRFGRRMLLKAIERLPEAKVCLPNQREIRIYQRCLHKKFPYLRNIWGAMDGLRLDIQASGDAEEQMQFYNGWTSSHCINNLLLFSPDGKIRLAYLNRTGRTHDSRLAKDSNAYDRLEHLHDMAPQGARVVVDSAFGSVGRDSLVKSVQLLGQNFIGNAQQISIAQREATSARQFAEWGMRAIQGSFCRLHDKIRWEGRGERAIMLKLIVHLHNFRAQYVGQNQIQSVFMPWLQVLQRNNIERGWRFENDGHDNNGNPDPNLVWAF